MPTTSPPPPGQVNRTLKYASIAASTLSDISDSTSIPFLRTISAVSVSILTIVQTVKTNQDECLRMVARIEEVLSVMLRLCAQGEDLAPGTLHNVGKFADTLQKIHAYVTTQQNAGIFKRFFRQNENTALLTECKAGLAHALDVFGIETRLLTTAEMAEMREAAEKRHGELVELFSAKGSDTVSLATMMNSTTSLLLLPPIPKIFHGRDAELHALVQLLLQDSARVTILGPGGIGKTSLATTALHHPEVSAKYPHQYFVSCESANTHDALLSTIASHLGVTPSRNPTKQILRHFSGAEASILLLDNFETSWEPLASRAQVEEFLSSLTDVSQLAILVTMRGAERPGSVRWTRPFLPPLDPLTDAAARQIFYDITDEHRQNDAEISELLKLTDNLPLAITLVANISAFEGYESLLSRWRTEKTTLLSEGTDKRSNLDLSILLSLSSPRMHNSPGALPLLSLLSLLPDGVSEANLLQIDFPMIPDMGRSKTTLIRTSLAYLDHGKWLRVLAPIREYIKIHNPPSPSLCRPLRRHFHQLVMLWDYQHLSIAAIAPRLAVNIANFESVIRHGLHEEEPDLAETLYSAIMSESLCRSLKGRSSGLLQLLPRYLDKLDDHDLHGAYLDQLVRSWRYNPGLPLDIDNLEATAIHHFRAADEIGGESALFLSGLANYFINHDHDIPKALKYFARAKALAEVVHNVKAHCTALRGVGFSMWYLGQYRDAQVTAHQLRRLAQLHSFFYEEVQAIRIDLLCRVSQGDLKPCLSLSENARTLLALGGFQDSSLDLVLLAGDGDVHSRKTEFAEAKAVYLKSSSLQQDPLSQAYDLFNLALIDNEIGEDTGKVRKDLDAIKSNFESMNYPTGIILCEVGLALVDIRDGSLAQARLSLEKSFRDTTGKHQEISIFCLNTLGNLSCGLYKTWTTYGWAVILMGCALKGKNRIAIHHAVQCLGDIFVAWGDDDTAESLFQVALDGFTQMDIHRSRGWCAVRLGDLQSRRGEEEKALELWSIARPCFVRSEQARDIELVDEKVSRSKVEDEGPQSSLSKVARKSVLV
ncbi:NB-ARC domain-containing protein [Favolaschia claudopus]|uniref:NB-ARC domain-containing protein n=1 Tax=Favolaschia claudopus TaxID=2862362 RepID=A0AAW0CYX9_9AGAR